MRYCAIQSNGSFSTREGRVRDDHFLTIACEVQKPKIDEKLKLLTDFGETEAICTEVRDDPARSEGVLLKVMARGPFEIGQQCWIIDRDGLKIGATVQDVFKQTIDSEVTLSTVLPA